MELRAAQAAEGTISTMSVKVKVHVPAGASVELAVTDEEHTPIDLTTSAAILASAGLADGRSAPATGVDFAVLSASSGVRFHVDGKRVSAGVGLELVAQGVRVALEALANQIDGETTGSSDSR
jgi:hypothetical protein